MSTDIKIEEKTSIKVSEPKRWKVIILNDDHTPIDFVIAMLIEVFKHTMDSATTVTMQVHETGSGIAGFYDFEIAEVKAVEATKMARENGFPLQIKIEEEQ
jgi:ATP-dependent Clp protease adaptor protein ClpS